MIKIFITYFLLTGVWSVFYTRKHYDKMIKLKPTSISKEAIIFGSFFIGFISFPITIPLSIFYKIKKIFITRKLKLQEHQHSLITGIAIELNIPKEEVLCMFIEFGNLMMLETEDEECAENIQKKFGHLKEYKHWKEIAKITCESFNAGKDLQ